MHERLFHGTEMQKFARNVSNILYFQAKKHSANLLLHIILGDGEYENIAKDWVLYFSIILMKIRQRHSFNEDWNL